MNLRKATLLAMISVCYFFLLRTFSTFFSDIISEDLFFIKLAGILNVLAGLFMVLFFLCFFKEEKTGKGAGIKTAAILSLVAYSVMLFLNIKSLLLRFNIFLLPPMDRFRHIEKAVPFFSSLALLLFFIFFHAAVIKRERTGLRQALFLALLGSSVSAAVQTFLVLNYFFFTGIFKWPAICRFRIPENIAFFFIPVFVFSSFAMVYFFFIYYRSFD